MPITQPKPVTGHVRLVEGSRGSTWYGRYRLPDGRQQQKKIGPAWLKKKEAPPEGYFNRASAEQWLAETLDRARRGELGGVVKTGATLGTALDAWLVWKKDQGLKASTLQDYGHMAGKIKADFPGGEDLALEKITTEMVERFRDKLMKAGSSNRTANKYLGLLHHFFSRCMKAYKLPANPVALVEKRPHVATIQGQALTPEEVFALVRAAASEQDGAIYLTAALTGMRLGELLELRWRDVDFERSLIQVRRSITRGVVGPPKNGKQRTVPMAPEVSQALAKLGTRDARTGDDDLVFVNAHGGYVGDRKLGKRYQEALAAAELRPIRFHDLRDTFGSVAINKVSLLKLRQWYGHARLSTTEKYLQYEDRGDDAELIADAFSVEPVEVAA